MPLQLSSLDTQYPPTWDGTPFPIPDVVDAETALRYMEGQDKVNYKVWQRSEGDLFKRDLASFKGVKDLMDFIGSRHGQVFNLPSVALAGTTDMVIAVPDIEHFPAYYIVAAGAEIRVGTASANTGVKVLKDSDDALLASCTTQKQTDYFAVDLVDRGIEVTEAVRLVLFNDASEEAVLNGWVAILPKTY